MSKRLYLGEFGFAHCRSGVGQSQYGD